MWQLIELTLFCIKIKYNYILILKGHVSEKNSKITTIVVCFKQITKR